MDAETRARLHDQLAKLGEMMGDGLHHEPDGRWIAREYAGICKKLGYTRTRTRNVEAINASMALALAKTKCPECGGQLKQTRSGARRAQCAQCGKRYQFKKGTR